MCPDGHVVGQEGYVEALPAVAPVSSQRHRQAPSPERCDPRGKGHLRRPERAGGRGSRQERAAAPRRAPQGRAGQATLLRAPLPRLPGTASGVAAAGVREGRGCLSGTAAEPSRAAPLGPLEPRQPRGPTCRPVPPSPPAACSAHPGQNVNRKHPGNV